MGDTILRVDDIQKFYGNKGNLTKAIAKHHRHMAPFNWHGRRNYFSCHNRPCGTKE